MVVVGELALWISLLMAAWSAATSFAGGAMRRADLAASGERGLYAAVGFVVLAAAGLWTALLTSDFSRSLVASHTSVNLPTLYKVSAFWAGQSGSMLLWCLMLALCAGAATFLDRGRHRALMPWVTGTNAAVLLVFVAATAIATNPYARLAWGQVDGRGLDPQLQHPAMAIYPPLLHVGYAATAIPFGFVVAALVTRRLDTEWLGPVRRWSLVSWMFLTLGILTGMWSAYHELGWSGYWMWDRVENASLLPWLTGTAFLHAILVQERRGMLRKWNIILVVGTFLLSVLGSVITHSGSLTSVPAVAQGAVGSWFAAFVGLTLLATAYLVATRLADLETPARLEAMLSREAAILYNNLVLVGIAFSVLWGMLFPILAEAVRGTRITVGAAFFDTLNVPLGLLLLALTGLGPLVAWRRARAPQVWRQVAGPAAFGVLVGAALVVLGMRRAYPLASCILASFVAGTIVQEFWVGAGARRRLYGEHAVVALGRLVARDRRRYGGYVVHAGLAVLFAAWAGLAFRKAYDVSLSDGERFRAVDPYGRTWTFTNEGLSPFMVLNRDVVAVALRPEREGRRFDLLTSELRQHVDARGAPTSQPSTALGVLTRHDQDVTLALAGVVNGKADLRISFNPLAVWVWRGGILLAIGGLIVMWPQSARRRQQEYDTSRAPRAEVVSA